MNYITEPITFRVPQNGGFKYRFYECADQIADLLDFYFDTQIEDMSRITDLIDDEIKVAQDKQIQVIGMTGQSGGKLKDHCDILLNVPSEKTMHIQETHIALGHAITASVERHLGF